jgi:hypothetical protein
VTVCLERESRSVVPKTEWYVIVKTKNPIMSIAIVVSQYLLGTSLGIKFPSFRGCALAKCTASRRLIACLNKAGIPCSSGAGGVGSIPANSDAQYVPPFRRWRFEMKLSPIFV